MKLDIDKFDESTLPPLTPEIASLIEHMKKNPLRLRTDVWMSERDILTGNIFEQEHD